MAVEPRFLLDTSIAVHVLGATSAAALQRLAACDAGSVVTSSICLAQLLVKNGGRDASGLAALLGSVAVLSFDEAAAVAYAKLPCKRRSFDRLIAAHALSLGLTVVTANPRDFDDIPDLVIEDWTS